MFENVSQVFIWIQPATFPNILFTYLSYFHCSSSKNYTIYNDQVMSFQILFNN